MLVILEKMELFNSRVLIILLISSVCVSCKGPEVNTPLGRIRGTFQKSIDGYEYSSFEGIPYAKPPVGELRFEEPVPVEPWIGIWEATRAYMCPQSDFGGDAPTEGTEDCLYLNIYVPGKTLDANKKFDINFHIHGGGFMIGSGDHMANSTFMMDHQDIIFVSINYRLNALGFLSTEDEEVPGNNGMKDQVLALKWVRDNIRYFGGNPDSITITGYSAGGASVHLHYLSPLSKGLFSRGISQSGSALNPWVIKENPLVFARRLAADVGCPISTTKELKKCLKTRPANLLVDTVRNYLEFEHQPFSPFAVVVEKQSRNAFLPEHPYFLLKKKQVADLPWITSVTRDEGILPAAYYCHNLEPINKNLIAKAHLLFDYNHTLPVHRREQFALKIRDHYFGKESEVNEENYNKLKNVFTDRLFTVGVEIAAKLQADANKSPVYFYYYNYEKANNKVSKFFCPNKDVEGVSHADDCVFAYGFFVLNEFSENDKKVRKVFQRFIQTFVNGKNPSFDENVKWLPTDSDELTYLNITDHDDIKLEKIKSLVPIGVWDEVNDIEFQITPSIKTEL